MEPKPVMFYYFPGAPGDCGCEDMSTPSFYSHHNPISTRGRADYVHPILVSTLSFESHRRACFLLKGVCFFFYETVFIFLEVISTHYESETND